MEPKKDITQGSLKDLAEQKLLNIVNLSAKQPNLIGNFRRGVINVVICDASYGGFTVNLPDAKSTMHTEFVWRKIPASNNEVILKPATGETITQVSENAPLLHNSLDTIQGGLQAERYHISAAQSGAVVDVSTLHSGSILFSNGTKITEDNDNLFWDNVNKRLGINNTNPQVSLHISDSTAPKLYLGSGGNNATEKLLALYYDVANSRAGIESVHNGTAYTPLILNPSGGNVGVRKTNPSEALDVNGNVKSSATISAVNLSASSVVNVGGSGSFAITGLRQTGDAFGSKKLYLANADKLFIDASDMQTRLTVGASSGDVHLIYYGGSYPTFDATGISWDDADTTVYDNTYATATILGDGQIYDSLGVQYNSNSGFRIKSSDAIDNSDFLHYFDGLLSNTGDIVSLGKVQGATGHFGGATDYSSFEADGTLVFNGAATVYDDIYIDIAPKTTGVGKPTLAAFSGNINKYKFAVNDITELGTNELLHDWKEGTAIELHVHWATGGLNDATVRGVKWEIDYTWANMQAAGGTIVFSAATTASAESSIAANEADKTHKYTSVVSFTPSGGKIGGALLMSLKRIASVTNTAPAADPWCLMVGVHYQIDTCGSRTISAK